MLLHGNALKKGFVMSIPLINLLIEQLSNELGDRQFFTIQDIHKLGCFGSKYAVHIALKSGKIPYIKISPRRRVIPRIALINYLKNNLSENQTQKDTIVS